MKAHRSQRDWLPTWKTLLSSGLLVLAFAPWDFSFLIWICLIPWLQELSEAETRKQRLWSGLWLGYFMSIGGLFWVAYVLKEFGNLPWPVSILGLLLLSWVGQGQFVLFAGLWDQSQRVQNHKTGARALGLTTALALSYAGIDWIIPKLFMDTLGHALYRAEALRQVADLGGAWMLTALIFFVNYTLWSTLKPWIDSPIGPSVGRSGRPSVKTWSSWKTLAPQMITALLLLIAAWSYGYLRKQSIQKMIEDAPQGLQIAGIQANIGDFEKLASERGAVDAAERVIDTFTRLSDQALAQHPKPTVLVWPETAFPSTFRSPHSGIEVKLNHTVEQFVLSRNITLLFGGYDHRRVHEVEEDYNSLFLLAPNAELQTYHKNILLLFGEYIPGIELFPFLKQMFPQVGNFGRGPGPEVLTLPAQQGQHSIKTGPVICYEALFPSYLIQSARNGSLFILNITNDSWFGPWGEPQLHLALSAFRSIETRLPMFRTTNTGISALILQDGAITSPTPLETEAVLNVSIPITQPIPTLIKLWGDWFGWAALLFAALLFLGLYRLTPVQSLDKN